MILVNLINFVKNVNFYSTHIFTLLIPMILVNLINLVTVWLNTISKYTQCHPLSCTCMITPFELFHEKTYRYHLVKILNLYFFVHKWLSCFKLPLSKTLGSHAGDLQRYDIIYICGLNFMSRCYKCKPYFIEFNLWRINHNIYYFVWWVTYFHSSERFILKIRRKISKLQAVEVHMHHGHVTT